MRNPLSLMLFGAVLTLSNLAYGQCGGPIPLLCDADADRDVDSADITAIGRAHGTPANVGSLAATSTATVTLLSTSPSTVGSSIFSRQNPG